MVSSGTTPRIDSRRPFRQAAVLGAGVMGAQIAAHLANAGLQVDLLDLPSENGDRNKTARQALRSLSKMNPAPLVTPQTARLITPGNFEDDLSRLARADWVIEAVVEDPQIKRSLLEQTERHISPQTIISTNTSGLSVHELLQGRSEGFKARFLGTHFFNPPRYLKLLEIIPTDYTNEKVLEKVSWFGRLHLGKGIVHAKDTPNFIGNRIGVYALMHSIRELNGGHFTIEEIDTLTGPLIGRPKSATFRTADVVGLDTLTYVTKNLYHTLDETDEARELFKPPEILRQLVENGALGAKTKAGFYRKQAGEIQSVNPETGTYESPGSSGLEDLSDIRKLPSLSQRWNALYELEGRAGDFIRRHIQDLLAYTLNRIPEICDNPADVDRAMRWGFGWEAGPFHIADMLGAERLLADIRERGLALPDWLEEIPQQGAGRFYIPKNGEEQIYIPGLGYTYDTRPDDELSLTYIKSRPGRQLWNNEEAALLDLGEGVALYEFRSKANTMSQAVMSGLFEALEKVETGDYKGMVIANEGTDFSVGANLAELAHHVTEGNMKPVEEAVEQFQQALQRVHYASKPVVIAPHSRTLGGACELTMAGAAVVAPTETYIGLVEAGVGLIPAGGGCMRMTARAAAQAPTEHASHIQPFLQQAFETLAMAKVAGSAQQAKELGLLRPSDGVIMHEDRRIHAARHRVIAMCEEGYRPPPVQNSIPVLGRPGKAPLYTAARQMYDGGYISEYDLHLAERLAHVLTGGALTGPAEVHENHLLELEREVFLSLLGEMKTQERVQSVLGGKKPVRN